MHLPCYAPTLCFVLQLGPLIERGDFHGAQLLKQLWQVFFLDASHVAQVRGDGGVIQPSRARHADAPLRLQLLPSIEGVNIVWPQVAEVWLRLRAVFLIIIIFCGDLKAKGGCCFVDFRGVIRVFALVGYV